jgi:hypothetical protein
MELQHTGSYTFKGSIPALAALEQAKQNSIPQTPVQIPKFAPSKIHTGNDATVKSSSKIKKKHVKNRIGTRP